MAILKGVGLPYETTSGTTIRPATSFLPDGTCKFAHLRQVGLGQGAASRCTKCTNPNRCDAKVESEQQ